MAKFSLVLPTEFTNYSTLYFTLRIIAKATISILITSIVTTILTTNEINIDKIYIYIYIFIFILINNQEEVIKKLNKIVGKNKGIKKE